VDLVDLLCMRLPVDRHRLHHQYYSAPKPTLNHSCLCASLKLADLVCESCPASFVDNSVECERPRTSTSAVRPRRSSSSYDGATSHSYCTCEYSNVQTDSLLSCRARSDRSAETWCGQSFTKKQQYSIYRGP